VTSAKKRQPKGPAARLPAPALPSRGRLAFARERRAASECPRARAALGPKRKVGTTSQLRWSDDSQDCQWLSGAGALCSSTRNQGGASGLMPTSGAGPNARGDQPECVGKSQAPVPRYAVLELRIHLSPAASQERTSHRVTRRLEWIIAITSESDQPRALVP